MRLSDYKGESVIDLIGDIAEPIGALFKDEEIRKAFSKDKNGERKGITLAVKIACKEHKQDVIQILSTINGQTVEEYQPTFNEFITQAVYFFKDLTADTMTVFTSSGQKMENVSSGSVSENTTENET